MKPLLFNFKSLEIKHVEVTNLRLFLSLRHHRIKMIKIVYIKVSKGAKIRNQLSTTPDPGYQWEINKLTDESQEASPFPAGDHKAHIIRRVKRQSKHKTEKNP